jgi:hypothetical protein
LLDVNVDK